MASRLLPSPPVSPVTLRSSAVRSSQFGSTSAARTSRRSWVGARAQETLQSMDTTQLVLPHHANHHGNTFGAGHFRDLRRHRAPPFFTLGIPSSRQWRHDNASACP